MTSFMARVRERHGATVDDFSSLHRWSVENLGAFWAEAWDFFGVIGGRGDRAFEPGADLIGARFFPDARLNVAENLMRRNDDTIAIVFRGESGIAREMTWAELHCQVSTMQQAMRAHGVTSGDRVVAWLPNVPDTYVVMLAAASLGAVFSSCSPDFGVGGVLDRFGQIEPVLLFATDSYAYGGKNHDCLDRLVGIPVHEQRRGPKPTASGTDVESSAVSLRVDEHVQVDPVLAAGARVGNHDVALLAPQGDHGRVEAIDVGDRRPRDQRAIVRALGRVHQRHAAPTAVPEQACTTEVELGSFALEPVPRS